MRLADLPLVPWTNELGSELLSNAELKTAYDKTGQPTHLVAYISNSSFQCLYGPQAWTSVFISGLWLLFSRAASGYIVLCRTTGLKFECSFACGPLQFAIVSFFRRGRKIATSTVKGLTLSELEWDDHGIHWLSKRLVRLIRTETGPGLNDWIQGNSHLSVHILPERALPQDFRAAAVQLH
jgi:hypothetical protein